MVVTKISPYLSLFPNPGSSRCLVKEMEKFEVQLGIDSGHDDDVKHLECVNMKYWILSSGLRTLQVILQDPTRKSSLCYTYFVNEQCCSAVIDLASNNELYNLTLPATLIV
jgi:hypothetical protein